MSATYRYLAGQHLDGVRRSDCTWLHKGRNPIDISGYVSWWSLLAGWQRTAWRVVPILVVAAFTTGWFAWSRLGTGLITGAIIAAYLTRVGIKATRRFRLARHTRRVTKPLAQALGPAVGQDKGVRPREWIDCPQDYQKSQVRVYLPPGFAGTDEQKERAAVIAAGKLGGEWEPTYHMAGYEPTLTLQHSPDPPPFVGWDQLAPHLESASEARPVLGLGSRGAPVQLDFGGDTPHVLVSVPSGGGKSVAARIIGAHVLHHGGQIVVLDYKRISHQWADGLDGVTYCRDEAEIHHALLDLQQEITARYKAAGPERRQSCADVSTRGLATAESGRRLLVIVEELNQTADILQAYWQRQPSAVRRGLYRSPAVMALQAALYAGRQADVNVLAMAQKGTANAFGGSHGGAARESAIPIIGASSSLSTWQMLAPDVTMPPPNPTPGRMYAVLGGKATAVQVGYLTDQQARLWAMSGRAQPEPEPEVEDEVSMLGFGSL